MFDNKMMQRLQEMQQKMEDTKKRLETISVIGVSAGGNVKAEVTGSRRVKSISISPEYMQKDHEELEDYIILAMNDALVKADAVWESEMQGVAGGLF